MLSELKLKKELYTNDTLCLTLVKKGEDFLTLTTNLQSDLQSSCSVFVNQSGDELREVNALVNRGILEPLSLFESSGYNNYQLYMFNEKKLKNKKGSGIK